MLVGYSDSESDDDTPKTTAPPRPPPPSTTASKTTKATFRAAEPGKVRIDLPSLGPETGDDGSLPTEGHPAKRARTAGAFSGFNSLLPAPKRTAQSAPKKGVSLKTSSEAAFSRAEPAIASFVDGTESGTANAESDGQAAVGTIAEPKLVGKATRFMPLSVSRKKKPATKTAAAASTKSTNGSTEGSTAGAKAVAQENGNSKPPQPAESRSLFSVYNEEQAPTPSSTGAYEPLLVTGQPADEAVTEQPPPTTAFAPPSAPPNAATTLSALASDLNLTASQRRQLLGRRAAGGGSVSNGGNSNNGDARVAHFNMDAEYAANEQARTASDGAAAEHRAVKAIAPGKHSLQQLVNNAVTQKDAMEDAWAQGKRTRGEAGSKYGWGAG